MLAADRKKVQRQQRQAVGRKAHYNAQRPKATPVRGGGRPRKQAVGARPRHPCVPHHRTASFVPMPRPTAAALPKSSRTVSGVEAVSVRSASCRRGPAAAVHTAAASLQQRCCRYYPPGPPITIAEITALEIAGVILNDDGDDPMEVAEGSPTTTTTPPHTATTTSNSPPPPPPPPPSSSNTQQQQPAAQEQAQPGPGRVRRALTGLRDALTSWWHQDPRQRLEAQAPAAFDVDDGDLNEEVLLADLKNFHAALDERSNLHRCAACGESLGLHLFVRDVHTNGAAIYDAEDSCCDCLAAHLHSGRTGRERTGRPSCRLGAVCPPSSPFQQL